MSDAAHSPTVTPRQPLADHLGEDGPAARCGHATAKLVLAVNEGALLDMVATSEMHRRWPVWVRSGTVMGMALALWAALIGTLVLIVRAVTA